MVKVAVIYKSKHGSTRKYAQWIAEETGADLFEMEKCRARDLDAYDTIIYGGAIHAGGILGIDFLKKNFRAICNKNILVFAVGLNVEDEAVRQECREINFTKNLTEIPCYFMRGAYHPEEIGGMDKMIMGMVKRMITGKRSSDMTENEKELLAAIEHGADYVERAYIKDLVDAVLE